MSDDVFNAALTFIVKGRVDHHAPCVPECTVCYQLCNRCDMVHHVTGIHDDVIETTEKNFVGKSGTFTLGEQRD
jgi:hypothetical protein